MIKPIHKMTVKSLYTRQMTTLEVEHMNTNITWKSNHGLSIRLNDRDLTINCQLCIDTENVKLWLDLTI